MTIEKPERENTNSRQHRDFGRHNIYIPKSINNAELRSANIYTSTSYNDYSSYSNYGSYGNYNEDNKFRFKNSLIVTPNYEIEFNGTGGVKYLKNYDDYILFTGGSIFFRTNNIQKMPVLLKREINKLSSQKKLIVEEKYNYEEKYEVHQNIILYYEENRLDYQILFSKPNPAENTANPANTMYYNGKDVTTEFSLNLSVPGLDDAVTYKKYAEKQEHTSAVTKLTDSDSFETVNSFEFDKDFHMLDSLEYIIVKCGKSSDSYMTIYPEKKQIVKYRNKSFGFAVPNQNRDKTYINLKIYLEKRKII